MTDGAATDPPLEIRARPKPVRRFSRKAIAIGLGGACLFVMGSLSLALSPDNVQAADMPAELYSTANKPTADGLSALPARYSDVTVKREVPELGPPLPGDLGAPILKARRAGKIPLEDQPPIRALSGGVTTTPVMSDIELAALMKETNARESGLFFAVSSRQMEPATYSVPGVSGTSTQSRDPFAALAALQSGSSGIQAPDPGGQLRKESFASRPNDASIYNPHTLEHPASPWQVMAGTIIPATLLTGINSDLPGQVIAQVSEPVYDTVTGNTLLIPQGSRLIGRYDSVIAYGQSRALLIWTRIIMPDGSSIRIENLPGTDGQGMAGLRDKVDHHTLRLFSAAALSSLISVGAELGNDDDDRLARAIRDAVQDGASNAGEEILRRQLSVQPTPTIRPGWRLRILVHSDIILKPYGDRHDPTNP